MLATRDANEVRPPTRASATANTDVLVLGLGNPILGDDGVGWTVARRLAEDLGSRDGVEFDCLSVGGLSLMERMLGYRHVILIDSIETGERPVGSVSTMELSQLPDPDVGHSSSAHDASLMTALATANIMGAVVPERVDVVAVEASIGLDFTETLSTPVAAAVPGACAIALALIRAHRR